MPIQMPAAPGFIDSEFQLESNTQKFESPLDKSQQRQKLAGSRWRATYVLPPMTVAQAAAWKVFLANCEGMANIFEGFDPDVKTARGSASVNPGVPIVDGAGQRGSLLNITGCPINVNGYLLESDYIRVDGMFLMITNRVNTDGSGNALLQVKPSMRISPADGAAVTIDGAYCDMVLVDDNQAKWRGNRNKIINGMSFSAVETF